MSTITPADLALPTTTPAPAAASLRRTTLVVGVGAAAVVTAAAAVVHAAGATLAVDGEMIPLMAFAQMTALGAVLGGILLAVLNRRADQPRRTFLRTTVALTAASCLPSVALPPQVGTKVALVALHVLAALIIVPVLARRAVR